MSLALGPLGRNGEAAGAVNTNGKMAAMFVQMPLSSPNCSDSGYHYRYSYSKTRGLFGGLSVEGSVIMERQDANFQAYDSPVTARMLLGGTVEPPDWALPLIRTLEACTGMPGGREWINDFPGGASKTTYAFGGGTASPGSRVHTPSFLQKKKKADTPAFPPSSWPPDIQSDSYSSTAAGQSHSRNHTWNGSDYPFYSNSKASNTDNLVSQQKSSLSSGRPLFQSGSSSSDDLANPFVSGTNPFAQKSSVSTTQGLSTSTTFGTLPEKDDLFRSPFVKPREELARPLLPHDGIGRAVAIYDFNAVEVVNLLYFCTISLTCFTLCSREICPLARET